MNLHASPLDC